MVSRSGEEGKNVFKANIFSNTSNTGVVFKNAVVTRHLAVFPTGETRAVPPRLVSDRRPGPPGQGGAGQKSHSRENKFAPPGPGRGDSAVGRLRRQRPGMGRGDPSPTKVHRPQIPKAKEEAPAAASRRYQGRQPLPHSPGRPLTSPAPAETEALPLAPPLPHRRAGPSPRTSPAPEVSGPGATASVDRAAAAGLPGGWSPRGDLCAPQPRNGGLRLPQCPAPTPAPRPLTVGFTSPQTTFPDSPRGSPALPPETRAELGVRSGSRSGSRSPPPPPPPPQRLSRLSSRAGRGSCIDNSARLWSRRPESTVPGTRHTEPLIISSRGDPYRVRPRPTRPPEPPAPSGPAARRPQLGPSTPAVAAPHPEHGLRLLRRRFPPRGE